MDIQTRTENDAEIVTVAGRLDTVTSPELEKHLTATIAGDPARIILNLSPLEYVSSAGLRVILMAAKLMKAKKKDILLVGLNGPVKEVFVISGFSSIFKIFDTEEAALL